MRGSDSTCLLHSVETAPERAREEAGGTRELSSSTQRVASGLDPSTWRQKEEESQVGLEERREKWKNQRKKRWSDGQEGRKEEV